MSVKLADPRLFWEYLPFRGKGVQTDMYRSGYMVEAQTTAKTTDGLTYNMSMVILAK